MRTNGVAFGDDDSDGDFCSTAAHMLMLINRDVHIVVNNNSTTRFVLVVVVVVIVPFFFFFFGNDTV